MSNISFDMSANDENVRKTLVEQQKEIAKLTAEVAKLNAASGETAKTSKEQAAAQATLNKETREAEKIIEGTMTAQQRYQKQQEKLDQLLKKGLLTKEQHAQAMAKEGAALNANTNAANGFGNALTGAANKMGTMIAGFVGMSAIIETIKSQYDALIQRQNQSRMRGADLAKEQEALIDNLVGEDAKPVFERIKKLSQPSGVKEAQLTAAVNDTLAAKGNMTNEDVFAAVEAATKLKRLNPESLPIIASAALDMRAATGLSVEESIGFMNQISGQARVKSTANLAQNVVPGIGSVMEFGADRQTAGALMAALSQGMGDVTGAQTKTSAISLAKQLEEYGSAASGFSGGAAYDAKIAEYQKRYNEKKIKKDDLKRLIADAQTTLTDVPMMEVLSRLQTDEQYRENFLRGKDQGGFGATFEAQALPAIRSLLSGGKQAQQFAAARAAMQAAPVGAFDAAVDARFGSPEIVTDERGKILDNIVDQAKRDPAGAEAAAARDAAFKAREALPGRFTLPLIGDVGAHIAQWKLDQETAGAPTAEDAIRSIEGELANAKRGRTPMSILGGEILPWMSLPLRAADYLMPGASVAQTMQRKNMEDPNFQKQIKNLEESLAASKQQLIELQGINAKLAGQQNAGAMVNRAAVQRER